MPPRTPEQLQEALAKAAIVRSMRAELKKELKRGTVTLADVLARRDDAIVGGTRVTDVLQSFPRIGVIGASEIMRRSGISSTRRVRGLGRKQRLALLAEFENRKQGGRGLDDVRR